MYCIIYFYIDLYFKCCDTAVILHPEPYIEIKIKGNFGVAVFSVLWKHDKLVVCSQPYNYYYCFKYC